MFFLVGVVFVNLLFVLIVVLFEFVRLVDLLKIVGIFLVNVLIIFLLEVWLVSVFELLYIGRFLF